MNKEMFKRSFFGLLKYALGFAIVAYLIWRNWDAGLSDVWQKHFVLGEPVNWRVYQLGLLCCMVAVLITFVRWYFLVRAQRLPFTLVNGLRLGMVGYFCNTFLPGSVGGDIIKAYFLAREQSRRTVAVATVLIDRLVGLWALCWVVALVGVVSWLAGLQAGPAEKVLQSITIAPSASWE